MTRLFLFCFQARRKWRLLMTASLTALRGTGPQHGPEGMG